MKIGGYGTSSEKTPIEKSIRAGTHKEFQPLFNRTAFLTFITLFLSYASIQ